LFNFLKWFIVWEIGVISVEELQKVMEASGFKESEERILSIIKTINTDDGENNYINYSDFIAASLDCKTFLSKQKLWSLFKYFDPTNTNYITVQDLKMVFAREGRKISDEDLREMIKENKQHDEDRLNFDEFCTMMQLDQKDFKSSDNV
jgi:calcium-dependent protein kinase